MIQALNQVMRKLEWHLEKTARQHDYISLYLLRSIPGVGQILALAILYEAHDIKRFPRVQDFSSYARLIRPSKESDSIFGGEFEQENRQPPPKMGHQGSGDSHAQEFAPSQILCAQADEEIQ